MDDCWSKSFRQIFKAGDHVIADCGNLGTTVLTNQFARDTPIGSVTSESPMGRSPWSSWGCGGDRLWGKVAPARADG